MQELIETETSTIQTAEFKTFKERGEWAELLFMAAAASHGYHVLKPCGESLEYDVGIEHRGGLIRVQVKSTTDRRGSGYLCHIKHGGSQCGYELDDVDLFAVYVVPEELWYLIPASVVLAPTCRTGVVICPLARPRLGSYKYEHYREAWELLSTTPEELRKHKRWEPRPTSRKAAKECSPRHGCPTSGRLCQKWGISQTPPYLSIGTSQQPRSKQIRRKMRSKLPKREVSGSEGVTPGKGTT